MERVQRRLAGKQPTQGGHKLEVAVHAWKRQRWHAPRHDSLQIGHMTAQEAACGGATAPWHPDDALDYSHVNAFGS